MSLYGLTLDDGRCFLFFLFRKRIAPAQDVLPDLLLAARLDRLGLDNTQVHRGTYPQYITGLNEYPPKKITPYISDAHSPVRDASSILSAIATMSRFLYAPLAATGAYLFLLSPNTLKILSQITAVQKSGVFPHGVPMRKSYTGIWQIDYGLQLLVGFVLQFTDGSNTDARAFAIYFLMGLMTPCIAIWALEASRRGNQATRIRRFDLLPGDVSMRVVC
jgi:hypothetical protein